MFSSRKGNQKGQSAMEYLMTYGWAILIIAIVLAALFALGVFSTGNVLGTSCIAESGFLCQSPILHAGTFSVTAGQSTGIQWTTANIFFVTGGGTPSSGTFVASGGAQSGCVVYLSSGLISGQTSPLTFNAPIVLTSSGALPSTCGTTFLTTTGSGYTGALWAQYTTSTVSGFQYVQLATVTLKSS